jgi:hypothetical protein
MIGIFSAGMNYGDNFDAGFGNSVEHQIIGVDNHFAHAQHPITTAIEIRVLSKGEHRIFNTLL